MKFVTMSMHKKWGLKNDMLEKKKFYETLYKGYLSQMFLYVPMQGNELHKKTENEVLEYESRKIYKHIEK